MNNVVKSTLFKLGWIGGNSESALEFIRHKFGLLVYFNQDDLRITKPTTGAGLYISGRCSIECAIETSLKFIGEL